LVGFTSTQSTAIIGGICGRVGQNVAVRIVGSSGVVIAIRRENMMQISVSIFVILWSSPPTLRPTVLAVVTITLALVVSTLFLLIFPAFGRINIVDSSRTRCPLGVGLVEGVPQLIVGDGSDVRRNERS